MSVTIAGALAQARGILAGGESPAVDAKVLLAHVLGQNQTYLFTWSDKPLSDETCAAYFALVERRKTGLPVAHLTGYRDFWTLRLSVNNTTLIPRPETELLVETALALLPESATSLCDLGTGTGAVALAVASERPALAITGVDKMDAAVALARHNAEQTGIDNVQFIQSDWFGSLAGSQFDMLVSNPPYVEENSLYLSQGDVRFEPRSALTSGGDGLDDIRFIINHGKPYLAANGWMLLEHGFQQAAEIRALFNQAGYVAVKTFSDLAGLDRITVGRIPACE